MTTPVSGQYNLPPSASTKTLVWIFIAGPIAGIVTSIAGIVGAAYLVNARYSHNDAAQIRSEKRVAYVNYLRVTGIAADATNGSSYEGKVRDAESTVLIVGNSDVSTTAVTLRRISLKQGDSPKYRSARTAFIKAAHDDLATNE